VGFPTRIKPDNKADQTPRVCPMCHNAAVQPARARTWFELCFIPLIPMQSKPIWICPICSWRMAVQDGWQPQPVGVHQPHHANAAMSPGGQQQFQAGYQPAYTMSPIPNSNRKTQ
ncbi:hypothetical protein BC835DRAFT_1274475, partial [Cytidiella melzeri]